MAQIDQRQNVIPNTGFVPYPILTEEVEPEDPQDPVTVQPVLAPDGSHLPAWDGSVADLMAADAYADCQWSATNRRSRYAIGNVNKAGAPSLPVTDQYLEHLKSLMEQFTCEPLSELEQAFSTFPERWVADRNSTRCNIDPQSGQPARLDLTQRDWNQYASFYQHFLSDDRWEDFVDPGGLSPDGLFLQTILSAEVEVEYADMNLCMAQRLRSQLKGGQSLFTPTSDQIELLAIIRERAQLAIVYYGLMAKVFSSQEPVPTEVIDPDFNFLILLRSWAEEVDPGVLQTTGEDFAMAVRLHLEATAELAGLLERQAATRPVGDVGFERADRDWGLGQPRIRLMNLLYGGDPIGTPEFPHPPGRSRGGVGRVGILPTYVTAEMQDPRVGTLLGMARASDALRMKVKSLDNEPIGFDVTASAELMYRAVEITLRSEACELETPEDPSCEPENIEPTLPDISQAGEYFLWRDHRVDPNHARILAQAFDEAFGELVRDLPEIPMTRDFHRHQDGRLHLFGSHQLEDIEGDSWLHVDPEFTTGLFDGHELMVDFAELAFLPKTILTGASPRKQGFVYYAFSATPWAATDLERFRNLGSIAALAFVREALVEGSEADAFAQPFFTNASSVLPEIDRAIGRRSVIVRPERTTLGVPCPWDTGETCQTFTHDMNGALKYVTDVITEPDDPMDRLTPALPSRQLHTIAIDSDTVGFDGTDRSDLDGYSTASATIHNYSGYASGYQKRSFQYSLDDEPVRPLLLRGDDPDGTQGEQVYMSLFGHLLRSLPTISDDGYITSFGGALNGIGQRAMSMLPYDWTKPAFDAFGFPTDWVPPADASLVGGAPGEPSYQYYLRSAKEAAQEATAAVQKAIDNLVEETLIRTDLETAEQRASTISDIETRALCGASGTCEVEREQWRAEGGSNPCSSIPVGGDVTCHRLFMMLGDLLAQIPVAKEVLNVPPGVAPTFPERAGSELQRILVRQWNAVQVLQRIVDSTRNAAFSVGYEVYAAGEAYQAAQSRFDAVQAEIELEFEELDILDAEVQAAQAQLELSQLELETNVAAANAVAERECSDDMFTRASESGKSFTSPEGIKTYSRGGWKVDSSKTMSFSAGGIFAQLGKCLAAEDHSRVQNLLHEPTKQTITQQIDVLLDKLELTPLRREALRRQRAAEEAARDVARAASISAQHSAWAQFTALLTQVQQTQGEVIAAVAELDQLELRAENAIASANLERDLAEKQADVRFGLQRKFRSYDMWRARALLESSRRVSVAARRAIEARFVVDLSDLQSPLAFVEAPAIWADEVYGSDLDAPAVVGLNIAPRIESAIYPNQLLDYVGNLERFLQGYTVTYPTSVASPDTDVVTLPGPERTRQLAFVDVDEIEEIVHEDLREALASESHGWTFSCANTESWLPHPGAGQLPLEDRLSTMCDGAPPNRMRYNFSLDPWGRLNQHIATRPLTQRHNVRWRQLAVNLIGTGIRDCQLAANPQACFSESYLRFQLVHAGPAWAMNHAQQWRAFDLPGAFIESGKALASEEWLDPIANSWNVPFVANVARGELFGRPVNGGYELIVELSPDVRPERIEQVQLLIQTDYWVRQQ